MYSRIYRHSKFLLPMIFLLLLSGISTEGAEKKDIGLYELSAPEVLSTLPVLSPTQDTILYDNNTAQYLDTTSNSWTGVRFTPLTNFELQAIYFAILNQYNNTTDGCSLYVVADDGLGQPDWPAGVLDGFWVPPPLLDMVWMQVDLTTPIRFAAYQDFHVIYGPAPAGPYPGTGWWNLLDSDGTTTQRSLVSHDNRQTWLTVIDADAFIRAGGEYDTIFTILDVYTSLPGILGDTIEVVGWYTRAEDSLLVLDLEDLEMWTEMFPHSYAFLTGDLPPSGYDWSYIILTVAVDTVHQEYSIYGETVWAVLEILSYKEVPGYEKGGPPRGGGEDRKFYEIPFQERGTLVTNNQCDDCKFALLITGPGHNALQRRILEKTIEREYEYKVDSMGYDPNCVWRLSGSNATKQNIKNALDEISRKIAQCERECKPTTLQKFYLGHGSGYHTGSSGNDPNRPQKTPRGWAGGTIDSDGDEEDLIPESELKFDFSGARRDNRWRKLDLDGDGSSEQDFRYKRLPSGVVEVEVWNPDSGKYVPAGKSGRDGIVVGVDLNGDGDKNDSFAWDEDLSVVPPAIKDDEWASWQKALVDSCLDSLFEELGQCFSGGFKKDEENKLPCKVAVIKAMASEEGEVATFDGVSEESRFEEAFLKALMEQPPEADTNGDGKVDWQEAFEWAKEKVKTRQTPQIWVKQMSPEAKLLLISKELKSHVETKYAYFDSLERKLDSLLSQPYQGLPPQMDSLRDCAITNFDSVRWVHEYSPLPESLKLEKKAKLISHGLICEKHLKKKGFEELERKIDSLWHRPYEGLPPDIISAFDSADVYYDSVEVVHEDSLLPEVVKLEKKLLYIARGLLKQLNAKMKSFEALEIKLDSLRDVPYYGMPAEMVANYNSAYLKFDSVSTVHGDPELEQWDKIQLKLDLIRTGLTLEGLIYKTGFTELTRKLHSTVCCQFLEYYCDMIPWGTCVALGGTPYVSSQYECIGGWCQIPIDPCDTIGYARPCTPNDPGICDTLYKEIYPGDEVFDYPGPDFVRVPLYVTHDLPNPSVDSIFGFQIPLCYTHSNPSKYCSLSVYWNNTDLYPYPTTDRSIFRHLPDMENPTEINWMMALSERMDSSEWNTRILDLDGASYFRMALAPTGTEDQRFGDGSRVLLATMTFKLEDTTTIYIDTCFWPPSSRLTFYRSDAMKYIPSHFFPQCLKITSISIENCGDCNGDGIIDLGDLLWLISYLYKGGLAPDPLCLGDVDCNDIVELGDVLYVISYLYKGGPVPCPECCSGTAKMGKFPGQDIERISPQKRPIPQKLPQAPGGLKPIE